MEPITTGFSKEFLHLTSIQCWHLAALLGRHYEAHPHYQEALQVAQEMRFRPEVAVIRLQLAELLLEHYSEERAEALEHLDFAISELREIKMQPALQRALKHREILGA